jgi:hypothetical protein
MVVPELNIDELPVHKFIVDQLSVPEASLLNVLASYPVSRLGEDDASRVRGIFLAGVDGCGGKASRHSYAEVLASTPTCQTDVGHKEEVTTGWQGKPPRCRPCRTALPTATLMRRPSLTGLVGDVVVVCSLVIVRQHVEILFGVLIVSDPDIDRVSASTPGSR